MHITVATLDGQHVLSVDVSNELDLASLKVLCEEELKIKASEMVLMHNGGHTSSSGGVSSRRGTGSSGAQQQFDPSNPRQLFDMVRSNPELLAQLRQGNPPVGDAIASNNYDIL
ncbi:unnamed protein product [Didymodactylos carnosus]|uniref:Ddi1/2 HDD domain-containing protein n=2 Tax=Didymodactylos carnosus TaxID=1234261 RepID=A0A813X269_9BILA|nr:unnamed protein product [Didymodactylos carnosus]CAF3654166.1 unnamed protein product [Didymodactylos carnosus]